VSRGGKDDSLLFRLGCALLELYPQAYRQRYGEELRAVLEEYPVTLATLFDLVLGAFDAHLRPAGLVASPPQRMRGTVSAALTLWIALSVVGAGFAKATEDFPFRAAEAAHPLLGGARIAVAVLAVAGAAVVFVAGAPLAVSILRQAWQGRSPSLRRAVVIPLIALAGLAAATGVVALIANQTHGAGAGLGKLAFVLWLGIGVIAASVCALGARAAVKEAWLHPAVLALAAAGAWLLARVMVAVTVATALYAILLAVYAQGLQDLPNGPFDFATSVNLAVQVVAMMVISALALVTARRGLRAAR
jgi:hypothetical protein